MAFVHLSRRALMRAMGASAASASLLNLVSGSAYAQASAPLRFLAVFTPQGTWHDYWRPRGGETDFSLQFPESILAALEPFRSRLLILDGLDYKALYEKEDTGHAGGIGTFLTGTAVDGSGRTRGASLHQHLAASVGAATRFRSVNLGVKTLWMVGDQYSTISFNASGGRIFQEDNPTAIYNRFFSQFTGTPEAQLRAKAKRQAVLDFQVKDLLRLQKRVAGEEKVKLDQHLDSLRDIERRLNGSVMCEAGTAPAAGSYTRPAPASIPAIAKLQTDLLARIFACDLTRVATLQFLSAGDHYGMPWLTIDPTTYGLGAGASVDPHGNVAHSVSADSATGRRAALDLARVQRWFTDQMLYLLRTLDSIPEGDGTVLDHTVILWGNELGDPARHANVNVPLVLAGGANKKFRMGRYLRYSTDANAGCSGDVCSSQTAHNHLLVSLCQAFGLEQNTFNDPDYKGPLSGLT
jgi:hypothetical protein